MGASNGEGMVMQMVFETAGAFYATKADDLGSARGVLTDRYFGHRCFLILASTRKEKLNGITNWESDERLVDL